MIVTSILVVIFVAGIAAWLPEMSGKDLPFGVRTPTAHHNNPVIRTATTRHRWWVAGSAVLAAGTSFIPDFGEVALMLGPHLILVGAFIGFMAGRKLILAEKTANNWFDGVETGLLVDVTLPATQHRIRLHLWVLPLAICVLHTYFAFSAFDAQPDPMPIHWNAQNEVDGWAAKNIHVMLTPVYVNYGLLLLLFGCSFLPINGTTGPVAPGGDEQFAVWRKHRGRVVSQYLMSGLATPMIATFTWISLVQWGVVTMPWAQATTQAGVIVAVTFTATGIGIWYTARSLSRAAYERAGGPTTAPPDDLESPDDDADVRIYWGIVQSEPNNPHLMVPKRIGFGTTINWAHPAGKAMYLILAVIIFGPLLVLGVGALPGR